MKTILVIGMGRFGKLLAARLSELGNEVMVVDKYEDRLCDMLSLVTRAQIGDCMEESVLHSLGIGNFDICFVCMGDNFQASLEITSLLKEMGAKFVVSKTDRDIHAKFLLRNGADEVIYPERDMAQRAAIKYSAHNVFDFIALSDEFSIFEIEAPEGWLGKTIRQVNVRSKHHINIIALKIDGNVVPVTSAEYIFKPDEHLIIAGNTRDGARLLDLKHRS